MDKIYVSGYIGNMTLKFPNGEKREQLYNIKPLNEYFVAVQKKENSKWTILDKYNNEKDSFYNIDSFQDGHFRVQKNENEPYFYLDLIGRIKIEPTQSGRDFYSYFKREFPYQDLDKDYFSDTRFLHAVVIEELNRAIQYYPIKFSKMRERALKQLEINEEISDWLFHTSNIGNNI